jgi:hypothetical protein
MSGMQIITLASVFIALATAGASSCRVKQAREAAETARGEAETLRARLEAVEAENAAQREILARAYDAVNRASEAVEEAATGHVERVEKIDHADGDWLMCPLPDGVRGAFRDGSD